MSINEVPPPPNPFPTTIHSTLLPINTEFHQIFGERFAGIGFNPSHEKLNRFSPIFHRGEAIPVLYAGSSAEAAIYETLFHDAHRQRAKRKTLSVRAIEGKCYGSWPSQRALKLATLHAPDLVRFNLTTDQLTATNARYYPQTARWAEAIHANHPDIQRLEWTSYRAGPERAFVLFGDRVSLADLTPSGKEVQILTDATLYDLVVECGLRIGVRVHRENLP